MPEVEKVTMPTTVAQTHNGPSVSTPENADSNEFDQVKAIVAPFRQILNTYLENEEIKCIRRIVANDDSFRSSSTPDAVVYTVYNEVPDGSEAEWATGRAAFPPDTSPEMQMAVLKLHHCDLSVFTFLPHVADALQKMGARVDWLFVKAKPRIVIRYSSDDATEAIHSVLAITSATGRQFFADLTIEQLGYEDSCWFSKKSDYLDQFTADDTTEEAWMADWVETVGIICGELDWSTYRTVPEQDRMVWVETHTKEILDRVQTRTTGTPD